MEIFLKDKNRTRLAFVVLMNIAVYLAFANSGDRVFSNPEMSLKEGEIKP